MDELTTIDEQVVPFSQHFRCFPDMVGSTENQSVGLFLLDEYLCRLKQDRDLWINLSLNEISIKRHLTRKTAKKCVENLMRMKMLEVSEDWKQYTFNPDVLIGLVIAFHYSYERSEKDTFIEALKIGDFKTLESLGYLSREEGKDILRAVNGKLILKIREVAQTSSVDDTLSKKTQPVGSFDSPLSKKIQGGESKDAGVSKMTQGVSKKTQGGESKDAPLSQKTQSDDVQVASFYSPLSKMTQPEASQGESKDAGVSKMTQPQIEEIKDSIAKIHQFCVENWSKRAFIGEFPDLAEIADIIWGFPANFAPKIANSWVSKMTQLTLLTLSKKTQEGESKDATVNNIKEKSKKLMPMASKVNPKTEAENEGWSEADEDGLDEDGEVFDDVEEELNDEGDSQDFYDQEEEAEGFGKVNFQLKDIGPAMDYGKMKRINNRKKGLRYFTPIEVDAIIDNLENCVDSPAKIFINRLWTMLAEELTEDEEADDETGKKSSASIENEAVSASFVRTCMREAYEETQILLEDKRLCPDDEELPIVDGEFTEEDMQVVMDWKTFEHYKGGTYYTITKDRFYNLQAPMQSTDEDRVTKRYRTAEDWKQRDDDIQYCQKINLIGDVPEEKDKLTPIEQFIYDFEDEFIELDPNTLEPLYPKNIVLGWKGVQWIKLRLHQLGFKYDDLFTILYGNRKVDGGGLSVSPRMFSANKVRFFNEKRGFKSIVDDVSLSDYLEGYKEPDYEAMVSDAQEDPEFEDDDDVDVDDD